MKKTIAVLGLGRFGTAVAKTLQDLGHDVLGIDMDSERMEQLAGVLTHTVVCDCTDEDALRSLGLRNFEMAVVAIGNNVEASILAVVLLKELGVPYVVAKATSDLHGRTLTKVGADRVIYPERDMAYRVAHSLLNGGVMDYIELSPEYTITEVAAPARFVGKTLRDLHLRGRFGITVMAIKRGNRINAAPLASDAIAEGDILVLLGSDRSVRHLQKVLQEQ